MTTICSSVLLLSTNHIIDLYCIIVLKEWYYLAFSNHNKNNVAINQPYH
jgi:hypothetical protein